MSDEPTQPTTEPTSPTRVPTIDSDYDRLKAGRDESRLRFLGTEDHRHG